MLMMNRVHFKFINTMMIMMFLVLQVAYAEGRIECIEKEREALLHFKAALVDRQGMLSSWTTAATISLAGSMSNRSGMVMNLLEHLDLSYNGFKDEVNWICHIIVIGSLPDLSVFSSLRTMFLDGNRLSGKIPEGNKLPSQSEFLSIKSNNLQGEIPKSFGNACALRLLDISHNSLSAEFPTIILHLSRCSRYSSEQLHLSSNQINGTIPDLSIFSSLKELYLHLNKLNGEISKDIRFPPLLEKLLMHSNSLKGMLIDYHFTNMPMLEIL
ncbi:hypothetical protein VNO78_32901 [Psophocarpus tetragonolobus]|uniref:Leucine-rich repeat-containing N-terminal plant-type domain-containing protein n=1 Tax=Psophocarpus tetragonolobus TaxID=3891 RepID=A0AAN9RPB9_PSOTE